MKNAKKLLALSAALALCLSTLAGCASPSPAGSAPASAQQPAGAEPTNDTLVASCEMGLEGNFSPFFALSASDSDVVEMFTIYSMLTDRVSNPVNHGIEGETRAYNGTDYTYSDVGNIEVTENADGTVSYDLSIREDMTFADGKPVTIDDLIFSLYVVLDPTYDGNITLYSVPIKGLEAYRSGMEPLFQLLGRAGQDNTDFTYWDEAAQTAFWADLTQAGAAFAQEIVDHVGADTVAECAAKWSYDGLPENATTEDFFWMMCEAYDWDLAALSSTETAGSSLAELMQDYDAYSVGVLTGNSADYIEGIERTGDYSLRITTTELDATTIYQMAQPIAPLHWYGDESLYNYDAHQFGFVKGDLSGVRAKTSTPLGAGPYQFVDYSNGVVYMEANPNYFKGEPAIRYLNFKETSEDNKVSGLTTATLDLADPTYSTDTAVQIALENGFSEEEWRNFDGPVLTTRLIDFRGYGYVGVNPNRVKVGDDPYSSESKALRKAIATLISVYRDEAIDSYYGPTASIINYPISNTSWAAPQTTDDGYQVAYSLDVNGQPIYTAGMSVQERYAAALTAALAYFEAAGYTVEEGRLTAAPAGAAMGYQVDLFGGGSGNHPSFLLLKNAADALASIGFTLTVNDLSDSSQLYAAYQSGQSDLWCGAWRSGTDPDMFQSYHSEGSTNYYRIADDELDSIIVAARKSTDQTYRKTLYQAAMEIVMDYAVEIPIYQRSDCMVFSTERVDTDSLPGDMTPYWRWNAEVNTLAVK